MTELLPWSALTDVSAIGLDWPGRHRLSCCNLNGFAANPVPPRRSLIGLGDIGRDTGSHSLEFQRSLINS